MALLDVPHLVNNGAPFTRTQASDVGLGGWRLDDAVRQRAVRRVLHRVYVDAAVADSRQLRVAALHLVLPAHGVLFGTTAAWAYGVDAFQPEDRFVLRPQCIVPHHATRRTGAGVRTVEGYISRGDLTELDGLRITVPERTTVDLLRRLRRPFALSAADAMAHAGLVAVPDVQDRIDRLAGYPGVIQARQLVRWIEPLTESGGESWQRLRLLDAGFPRPAAQVEVRERDGRLVYRLDLAYVHVLVACEYDGAADHSTVADTTEDRDRQQVLHDRWGWRVVVSRKADVLGADASLEVEVGRLLDRQPVLPRAW